MDKDKITPFTELDYEEMMKMRKAIFQPEFLKIMDLYNDYELNQSKDMKLKIFDFLLNLTDNEDDARKQILMFKPIIHGLYEAMISVNWGITTGFKDFDKVK